MTKFTFLLDSQKVGFVTNILREACAVISGGLYILVRYLLQAIFHLANFDIADLADEMMNRIYIIIGLFMLFKITISLLNYLVNPDKINDKETGASKMLARVIISLAMLIALPGAFSIMTDLQNQLLPVLPRIIIGKDTAKTGSSSDNLAKETANNMVTTILQGFAYKSDSACQDIKIETIYDLADNVNVKCESNGSIYALTYHGLIALIVAILMVYVTFSLAIATAMRAFKLIILRVIAPAPVLSYIDPKSSKSDGMFSKWVKTFISTWAELLVNLGIIYFIIFMIQKLITDGNWVHYLGDTGVTDGSALKGMVLAFIIIGLLMFAREAPKFIMDALGIKSSGGFGRMLGMGATALGGIGSGIGNFRAANQYAKDNNQRPHYLRNFGAGLLAGAGGIAAGGHALLNDKDGRLLSGVDAQIKRNNASFSNIMSGGTFGGRAASLGRQLFTGESTADVKERSIKNMEAQKAALSDIKSRVSGEMVKSTATKGSLGIATDVFGNSIGDVNYKSFMAQYESAKSQGASSVNFQDTSGNWCEISMSDAEMQKGYLLKTNEDDYIHQVDAGTITDSTLSSYMSTSSKLGKPVHSRNDVNGGIDQLSTSIADAKVENAKNVANRRGTGNSK